MNPWVTFLVCYVLAATCGIAILLDPSSKQVLSLRSFVHTIFKYGAAGSAFVMLSYEYLGGDQHPERVVAASMLVGLRIIKWNTMVRVVARVLNVPVAEDKKHDD